MKRKEIIKVKNLSKTYSLNGFSIRDSILGARDRSKNKKVLRGVSFNVYENEFFGIIGTNGSGKSTLLNLLLGSLVPDKGTKIEVNGSVIRLALGIGFDPNLSVKENVYLNSSLIGLSFKDIGKIYHDIIEFSELENYEEIPIKKLSSGMKSRLAFAIAVKAKAQILLIDEFFGGVGDEFFKAKSEKIFRNLIYDNRTIIFVSHNLKQIEKYCDRVMLLNEGIIVQIGEPSEVLSTYKDLIKEKKRRVSQKSKSTISKD